MHYPYHETILKDLSQFRDWNLVAIRDSPSPARERIDAFFQEYAQRGESAYLNGIDALKKHQDRENIRLRGRRFIGVGAVAPLAVPECSLPFTGKPPRPQRDTRNFPPGC
jgi:hypothetical protein